LGGEDIVPYVGIRAVARQRKAKISVIKFDQHFDLCWEPRYWAGSAWARCMEANYLQPENLAVIGIRGLRNPTFFHEVARELGVAFWTLTDIDRRGIADCVMEAIERVTKDTDFVYISFDTDVMDTACMPAQKYPEPAGMTAREILHALRLTVDHGPPLCGFDIDCLAPRHDVNGIGTHLAARCVLEVIASYGYRRQQDAARKPPEEMSSPA
jgi:agmatinase